jgi:hypothetical protein
LIFHERDTAREILKEISKKLNDPIYLNPKQFCIVPIIPKGSREGRPANTFSLAKYGGKSSDYLELMFNN